MVQLATMMKRFDRQGEKTGWTYIEIPADLAQKLKPGNRKEFKVKGKIDKHPINRVSLLPMGGGAFIMPVNGAMRKAIGKRHGAMVKVELTEDKSEFVLLISFNALIVPVSRFFTLYTFPNEPSPSLLNNS